MNGFGDLRSEALTNLAFALEVAGFLANVNGHYAVRLTVISPAGMSGWVICDLGYGGVEWFWWHDGTPIAPAAEWDVAVEEIGYEIARSSSTSRM